MHTQMVFHAILRPSASGMFALRYISPPMFRLRMCWIREDSSIEANCARSITNADGLQHKTIIVAIKCSTHHSQLGFHNAVK